MARLTELPDDLLEVLRRIDTPTVSGAIEVAQGRRGHADFTRQMVVASDPVAPAMVGFARTARIRASAPSREPPDTVRARRMAYYRYMAEGPRPAVAVVQDQDHPACVGAYWGEINATVHRGLGLSGTLTNGLMRDLGDLPSGYPILAGGVGPSHFHVHVTDIGGTVEVLGLTVTEGDLIHADRHGALVIPPEVVPDLAVCIERLVETEKLILEPARQPGFDIAAFETAWAAFEAART